MYNVDMWGLALGADGPVLNSSHALIGSYNGTATVTRIDPSGLVALDVTLSNTSSMASFTGYVPGRTGTRDRIVNAVWSVTNPGLLGM